MQIGDLVRFEDAQFFNGAVQLGWVLERPQQADAVARAFVFHGPRYHAADNAEQAGLGDKYRLKDSASYVLDLLGSLREAAAGKEVNPYWLTVAGYGSGKSHLSVVIAALLSQPRSATACAIVDRVRAADGEIGGALAQALGALDKPVLVLPIDGSRGFHLGTALSRIVFRQLDQAGVDAEAVRALSPRFQTAERFVERNFDFRRDAFAATVPGRDAASLIAALREQDEAVFDGVNGVYTEANGHPIPIEGQESAQAVIGTLSKVYCAEDGPFSHVLILFDELGLYLEHAADQPERAGARVLQEIFQGVQDNSGRVHFIGFIQYELTAYLKRFGSSDLKHLQRYITRFDGARKWYLSTNLETLFAHMLRKDNAPALAALWAETGAAQAAHQTWQRLSGALPRFHSLSVWADEQRFAEMVGRGCWPLHPLAVWFLTRQGDLVQQRSALAFVKDVTDRLATQPAIDSGRLHQVSAADLVLEYMLTELVAAERQRGGATAELLQGLLEKHAAELSADGRRLLAGVAVIDKVHALANSQPAYEALLGEATALAPAAVSTGLATLSNLGALEWNPDRMRYELLSDGASRAQFEHWMRNQRRMLGPEQIRQLFVRRGAADCPIEPIRPDFDRAHDINTGDWYFEATLAHIDIVARVIAQAFDDWQQAHLPTEAKGRLVYLYLHLEDDPLEAERRIDTAFAEQLERAGADKAPIWVVAIEDRHGRIADHLARLSILDEKASTAEQESYRRFIPDEQQRSQAALKQAVEEALKERRYRVAGFAEPPSERLKVTASAIFKALYPKTVPFPFDGFATTAGGGAKDAVLLAKNLIAGNVNYAWIQSQPTRLRNRVLAVLGKSWEALNAHSEPTTPSTEAVKTLYERLQQAHQEDFGRSLLGTYRQLIAPPYGLNASSAAVLLGLLLGVRHPQRVIETKDGQQMLPAAWIEQAFSKRPGRHHFDEAALAEARLRFFDSDAESRWRALLDEWDRVERYDELVAYARKARDRLAADPLPPAVNEDYLRLQQRSDTAAARLNEAKHHLSVWQEQMQRAFTATSVHHALKFGAQAAARCKEMQQGGAWPAALVQEFRGIAETARELVAAEVDDWIPRQHCQTAQQVGDFRDRTDAEARWLKTLGFTAESARLTAQAQQVIARIEERQRHSLTLAQCEDYPRQPDPTASTPVLALRDAIRDGDSLIAILEQIRVITDQEKNAFAAAIRRRQSRLREAETARKAELGKVYELKLDSEEQVREAAATIERLRQLFAGMPDEAEINDLALQLQRILTDAHAREAGEVSVERLQQLQLEQAAEQIAAFRAWLDAEEIEPPPAWDLDAIYRALVAEQVEHARQRSTSWLRARTAQEVHIPTLDRHTCAALMQELQAAPAYLSAVDRAASERMLDAVRKRLTALEEAARTDAIQRWQRPYLNLGDTAALDRAATEQILRHLAKPPYELRPDEQRWQQSATERLTARLDQLSIDDLIARIEGLSRPMRQALFQRLELLVSADLD